MRARMNSKQPSQEEVAALPDVHEIVVTAMSGPAQEAAAGRPEAAAGRAPQNGTAPASSESAGAENNAASTRHAKSSARVPQAAPWNKMSDETFSGARSIDIMETLSRIAPEMRAVESEIERLITSPVKLIADLASHTLGAGGKRLRPALTILAAKVCETVDNGASTRTPEERQLRVTTCAASVELMHTTSLIHDDVVDAAATRRGKPAANLIWGNETSVLVGDYLFAQVFVTVAQPQFSDLMPAIAQSTSQLCAGELLETQTRGLLTMKESQYLDIIALKTAALTECACRLGAMAVGADEATTQALANYGRDIGMAFQIVDDVFDIVAAQGRVGKPVGNDIREGDITLPMLRVMQSAEENTREELRGLIGKDPISDEEVQRALDILRSGDAVEYSLGRAREYVDAAKTQLETLPDGEARAMLRDVADYVLSRDK
jgi:geranylgeranyl pyrophosphate synthase